MRAVPFLPIVLAVSIALLVSSSHPVNASTPSSRPATASLEREVPPPGRHLPPLPPGSITTIAGTGLAGWGDEDVDPLQSKLYFPIDITMGPDGLLYILDWNNHRVRVIESGVIHTVIGTGQLGPAEPGFALEVDLNHPTHLAFDPNGDIILTAWHNSKVLHMDVATSWVDVKCGDGTRGFSGDGGPCEDAVFNQPSSTVVDRTGRMLISDQQNQRIRLVDGGGIVHTAMGSGTRGYCGDGGPAIDACFNFPVGQAAFPGGKIALGPDGELYIADTNNHVVRMVDGSGNIHTVAGTGQNPGFSGDGGPATSGLLRNPSDVATDARGHLYIADTFNHCIRMVDSDGVITTVAGQGGSFGYTGDGGAATDATLNRPWGIEVDAMGNLYIADSWNHVIRMVVGAPEVVVQMDIRPGTCPNPLNVDLSPNPKAGGVLPVALLGSDEFDVLDIDATTLALEGVAPIRHAFEDVAAPTEREDPCDCRETRPDGITDLTLKFTRGEIIAAMGEVSDREMKVLTLTGQLRDGTPFESSDCVRIKKRTGRASSNELAESAFTFGLGQAVPNPFNPVTTIHYTLPSDMNVRLAIYDVAGRLVETLVDGHQTAGGHSIEWNASGMASGVYFYHIEGSGLAGTRKLILLK